MESLQDLTRETTDTEVFRFVVEALMKQGVRSGMYKPVPHDPDDPDPHEQRFSCLYRGPDGCKCAAGHLIEDRHYNPNFEGVTIRSILTGDPETPEKIRLPEEAPIVQWANSRLLLDFVEELQACHDRSEMGDFRSEFLHELEMGFKGKQINPFDTDHELGLYLNDLRVRYGVANYEG